jgi:hypothetical protein
MKSDQQVKRFSKLLDLLKEFFLETMPSMEVRNKGDDFYIETIDSITPTPFPCITIKVWPNGKPE